MPFVFEDEVNFQERERQTDDGNLYLVTLIILSEDENKTGCLLDVAYVKRKFSRLESCVIVTCGRPVWFGEYIREFWNECLFGEQHLDV